MAELYAKPYEVIDTGYNPQQTQQGSQDAEMQSYLDSLPPEERQKAIERINAPLSGEELALMAKSGERLPTLEDYAEIEKFHKNHEVSFIDGLGRIAEGGEQVMNDLVNAATSFWSNPADATSKMPATAVEAFAQGTRNFYGMLAQSQNPDSALFRVKDFLNGTGTIEDRYNQYIEALKFNKQSAELAEGKQTLVMDKDLINHEVTQAMAYIADPTLFIPFGKVASTGLRAVGLGEKLTLAGARAAAIKNGIIGNTIKWGAGQPLEFLGGAVRNTIDYGLERAGAAFEATTGIGAKEFAQTARMSGIGFSASAVAGHAVPYASTISDAYLVGSSARGFGEALTLIGDTMKKNQFGRGINSWAAESLAQAEKNGVALSPHAKGLLKTLNAVDPLFAYGWNGLEGAAEGALIGGGLGYLSDGAEGMYSGIGAGIALGGVGATAGKVVADVTGGTNVARRAVQAKMVIEGHKVNNPKKAMFFQAMQTAAEARGKDVDLVNGIIAGIDNVAPNFEFHALTPDQFKIEAEKRGYNPDTGKFMETSALDVEFGGDRASKSKAMYVLRSVGGDFVGNRQGFLDALKKASAKDSANPNKPASNIPLNLRKYIDVAKTFEKLSKTQQEAILKEIDGQTAKSTELGGKTKLREYYDALTWSEAWTDSIVKKFESDREGARKDIAEMLAQETDKNGKLNSKGRALADKLRAEGFLDKDNKLLRERNLLNADLTLSEFRYSKGAVIGREADGKTHMYINLSRMGDETFPHELFHTIMRESPMKKHFTDTLIHKLLGTVDKDGNLVRPAEVNLGQVTKFFKKYIDLTHRNDDGTLNAKAADERFKQVQEALAEYQNAGENKKISDKARSLIENYTEEFGAYYFSHWLMGRNRNTLFFGGELKGIEGLVERAKDSFKDFWQSKISKSNPEFDFSRGLNEAFDRSKGLGRISAMDYYMRDMVRAASNANREVFRPDSMTLENLRDFERSNGLRNLTTPEGTRRLNPREQVTQNIRLGKEAYKILSGLDKNLRTSKDVLDENGKQIITGRLSEAELDALVKGGIVPRAWADKVNQGYAMLDGTVSNIFSAGYLGKTEQTTDASYPRLTGKDVSFKNRKAVLFDVETKVKADGTFYTLFHTLDLAVIEQRGNHLWQNVDYRNLWNGDRAAFEADFFRYISNASKASTDPKKLDSATLFETGDGNGAKRRDVMHQMAGMALQTGDAYKHQPIAVIPEGIRHSVTTFNIDGMTMPRIETGTRYDINMGNAHKFIRENWQPAEMKQEKTPAGTLFTHETGFKFSAINGKYSAYTNDGSKIGTYGTIREATFAAKNLYNKAQENIKKIANDFKQKEEQSRKNLQPLDDATYEEAFRVGDIFKTKRMQEIVGNSKLIRQTFDEFRDQKIEEIINGKNEQEKGAILNQLFSSEFKELIDLEAELKKTYDEFGLEARQLQEQETEIIKRIAEFSQEKKRLQESGNPEAKVDIHILEMYERIYKRKQEVNKRLSEIVGKMHDEGITDLNSHYYITKRFLQNFNETGKLSEEAVKFAITPRLIKAYEANFETGKAVTFLANHGTPNHELMVSKTFDMGFLGRNTGSMSAFNATFFAGSKETSVNYVGNPIAKTWVRDFIQARKYYVKNFSPELKAKLESLLSSDTSKGVVQKVSALMANAHIEFPDDFKLKDTGRKTKEGEPIIKPQPETQLGYDIDGFLDRALEGANDEGFSIGGYEMAWNEEGKKPYLLRNIVKMDNPYVHEYAKADYRDETFASVIRRAKEAGHDGVIFKNTKDGGGLDTIFASFAKNEDNKIFTLETTEDTRFAPRGTDEAGNKVKGGSEIEGRNYQPTEEDIYSGGRVYDQNSKQFKSGFVGLYAAENPDRVKGISLQFMKRADGSHRIRLTDNSKKGESADIGHITANIEGDRATLSSHINEAYRGKKLAYVVYSEMAERLRAMGVTAVDGQIVNRDGIPIKVRERIIGDTRDLYSGRRINYVEGANRIRDKQEMVGSAGGIDVTNTLYKQARYQPDEADWSTQRAIKARENQPRQLWTYPNTENFKKWAGKLKFIGSEEDANKAINYDKGFVTTVFKGVDKRTFDKFSERPDVIRNADFYDTPVEHDPNFFVADEAAASEYAGKDTDISQYNKEAQKAVSLGVPDMYYIKSEKPANLLSAHKLQLNNPKLYEIVKQFWDKKIKDTTKSFPSPQSNFERFLTEVAMGRWLKPEGKNYDASDWNWRATQWQNFHKHLLKNGYDSIVMFDNSVSKKAPSISIPQETANVKGSSNYGEFSRKDSRYNFQPDEGRKYNKGQMDNQFIGRQAAERRDLIDGIRLAYRPWDKADGKDEGRKKIILTRSADGAEIGRIDFDYEHLTKYGLKSRGFGENEDGGIIVDGINVKVHEGFQGKGYQHILYSEMFERARALSAVGFSQSIENKKGLPLKSVNRVIGEADNFIASLSEPDPQRPTQENFDRLMAGAPTPTGDWTSNEPAVQNWGKLNKKAWYQPDETKIGTQSSNVKLLLEGMASGRILRTSSYKGLGLEDSLLIAHTPDTAKIGQVTAGDKALADLQGGIFYAIANGNRIWASNFAGEGETNHLINFAKDQLEKNPNKKTYILLVKPITGDNSKIFASVDGARGVSSIFKHLNDSKVMTDLKYINALKNSAKMHLKMTGLEGLGKEELYARIDDALLNSKKNGIGFKERANFTREIATQFNKSGAFDSKKSKKALMDSFHQGFERGFSKVEMERVFGNLMAEDIIKNVPAGHVYGALEITSPLKESRSSNHRGYDASIEQESGEPARLIIFDKTDHVINLVNRKDGDAIPYHDEAKGSYMSYTGGNIPYQEVKGKSHMPFQPAEVHGITPSEGFKWFKRNKFKNIPHEREIQIDNILNDVLENGLSYNEAAQKNNDTFKNVYRIVSNYVNDNPSALKLTPAERVKSYNYKWFAPLTDDANSRVPFSKAIKIDNALDDIANKVLDIETASKKYQIPRKTLEAYIRKARNSEKGFPYFLQGINTTKRDAEPYVFNEDTKRLKVSDENKKLMLSMYEDEGLSVENEIAPQFGISPNMIYKFIREQKDIRDKKSSMQPVEYTEFKSEQSPTGRIMRNAKGYVITMANNKFRVYNPAKAILGVYNSEEEAKKRIYREIPKQ